MNLSVIVITYNHEPFIRQALDSVLAQQTDFDFEILISEDYSTDATRRIVQQYAETYPNQIRLLLSEKNECSGIVVERALVAAQGEYVAFIDGDDYWTSPHKLQRQWDFMKSNPELTLSWHNVQEVDSEGRPIPGEIPVVPLRKRVDFKTMLGYPIEANPMAVMIRRSAAFPIPAWYRDCPTGDTPLWLLCVRVGYGEYLDGVLGDYRIHSGGAMSGLDMFRRHNLLLQTSRSYLQYLDPAYHSMIRKRLARLWQGLAAMQREAGKSREARLTARRGLKDCPHDLRLWILAYAPWIWLPVRALASFFHSSTTA